MLAATPNREPPPARPGLVVPSEKLVADIRTAAAGLPERLVLEALGVSKAAFARVLAGLDVKRGTLALAEQGLPKLQALAKDYAASRR